jgi:endonuclease III
MSDIIAQRLREDGYRRYDQPRMGIIEFTGDHDADELVNDLHEHPHAYVIACIADRQVPSKVAWILPLRLRERIGTFEFSDLSEMTEDDWITIMLGPPVLHRFAKDIGICIHEALALINKKYGGHAASIWSDNPESATLVKRFLEFRGVGPKIAGMAANILVQAFRVDVVNKSGIDATVDTHNRRVMKRLGLVGEDASDTVIVKHARTMNPEYPGIIDMPLWHIGTQFCKPKNPLCDDCPMGDVCMKVSSGV